MSDIEQIMRDLQAKYHEIARGAEKDASGEQLASNVLDWPPCCPSEKAPAFPPDDYYDSVLDDPNFAVELLKALRNAVCSEGSQYSGNQRIAIANWYAGVDESGPVPAVLQPLNSWLEGSAEWCAEPIDVQNVCDRYEYFKQWYRTNVQPRKHVRLPNCQVSARVRELYVPSWAGGGAPGIFYLDQSNVPEPCRYLAPYEYPPPTGAGDSRGKLSCLWGEMWPETIETPMPPIACDGSLAGLAYNFEGHSDQSDLIPPPNNVGYWRSERGVRTAFFTTNWQDIAGPRATYFKVHGYNGTGRLDTQYREPEGPNGEFFIPGLPINLCQFEAQPNSEDHWFLFPYGTQMSAFTETLTSSSLGDGSEGVSLFRDIVTNFIGNDCVAPFPGPVNDLIPELRGWQLEDLANIVSPDFNDKPERERECGSDCSTCPPTDPRAVLGSVDLSFPLGRTSQDRSAGYIGLRVKSVGLRADTGGVENVIKPNRLIRNVQDLVEPSGFVATVDSVSRLITGYTLETERTKVVVTPSVGDHIPYQTTITTYERMIVDGAATPLWQEVSSVELSQTYTGTLENRTDVITVTKRVGLNVDKSWEYRGVGENWTLKEAVGTPLARSQRETITLANNNSIRTTVREIVDTNNVVHASSTTVEQKFAWGWEIIQEQSGAETPSYRWYNDTLPGSGGNYGRLAMTMSSDGHWTKYVYDSDGNLIRAISQFKNNPATTPDASNQEVETTIVTDTDVDYDCTNDVVQDRVVRLQGVIVERTIDVYMPISGTPQGCIPGNPTHGEARRMTIRCANPILETDAVSHVLGLLNHGWRGTTIQDDVSMTLTTQVESAASWQWKSPTDQSHTSDGRMSVTTFNRYTDPNNVLILMEERATVSGRYDPLNTGVPAHATRTISKRNVLLGVTVEERTEDLKYFSPVLLSRSVVESYDNRGRVLRRNHSIVDDDPNTPEIETDPNTPIEEYFYDCCGLAWERDRHGVRTDYSRDIYGRVWRTSVQVGGGTTTWPAISHESVFDPAGRVLQQIRESETGTRQITQVSTFNTAGRLLQTTDPRSGAVTTYNHAVESGTGLLVDTQTLPDPDGSGPETSPVIVTKSYPDGSPHSTSGSGAHAMTYDSGVELRPGSTTQLLRFSKQAQGTQWTKNYVDGLGRSVFTLHADGAVESTQYLANGRLQIHTDADNISSISCSGTGEAEAQEILGTLPSQLTSIDAFDDRWSVSVQDADGDLAIDWIGTDRISLSRQYLEATTQPYRNHSVSLQITEPVAGQSGFSVLEVSRTSSSLDGNDSTASSYGRTSTSVTTINRAQTLVTSTTTGPTGATSSSLTQFGRQQFSSATHADTSWAGGTFLEYDQWGRVIKTHFMRTSNAAMNSSNVDVTESSYDSVDRLIQQVFPLPDPVNDPTGYRRTVSTEYDNLGRTKKVTLVSPEGTSYNKVTEYTYAPTGEVLTVRGFGVNPVDYTYDDAGRMKTLTTYRDVANSGTAAVTTWNYSSTRGWLTSKVYADSSAMNYQYTPAGRLAIRTNARNKTTTYAYGTALAGNLGLLRTIDYSDTTPDVIMTYDRRGRMTQVIDAAGTRSTTYTEDGRPINEVFTTGSAPIHHLSGTGLYNTYSTISGTPFHHLRTQHDVRLGENIKSTVLFARDSDDRINRVYKSHTGGSLTDGADVLYTYDPLNGQVASSQSRGQLSGTGLSGTFDQHVMDGIRTYDRLGRLTDITWNQVYQSQTATVSQDQFGYDWLGRRVNRVSGTNQLEQWAFQYDELNQLTAANASFADNGGDWQGAIPGMEFGYAYDHIGNRTSATFGGASTDLYTDSYTPNSLNQYTSRGVTAKMQVTGHSSAPVVQIYTNFESPGPNTEAARHMDADGFYYRQIDFDNLSGPVAGTTTIQGIPGSTTTYKVLFPATPEAFTYDSDGNLAADGLWTYEWDAENRLVAMQIKPAIASLIYNQGGANIRVEFAYDYMGRRISKKLLSGTPVTIRGQQSWAFGPTYHHFYLYDPGTWNLSAILFDGSNPLNGTLDAVHQTFAWGPDLSSTEQGAGGIGGLAVMLDDALELGGGSGPVGHMFPVYDGNGNITRVYSTEIDTGSSAQTEVAEYRYGPFGENRGQFGEMAVRLPFRWSTKFTDNETALVYYGYRYYSGSLGRWVSRDPREERGGLNLLTSFNNQPLNNSDPLGLTPLPINPTGMEIGFANAIFGNFARFLLNRYGFDQWGAYFFFQYLYGGGRTVVTNNGPLADYMKKNKMLSDVLRTKLTDDSVTRTASGPIALKFHAQIQNGFQTGYEMLHGTNGKVGDFFMHGHAEVISSSPCEKIIHYDMTYEWNDVMDPNFNYGMDGAFWLGLQAIAAINYISDLSSPLVIPVMDPEPYQIHIRWQEQAIISKTECDRTNQGYPFGSEYGEYSQMTCTWRELDPNPRRR